MQSTAAACYYYAILISYYTYYTHVQVSCASSSSELTDRTRFLYHFGVLATEANLAFGFYSIIRHYDWRRVVILLQEENLFIVVGHTYIFHRLYSCYHSRTRYQEISRVHYRVLLQVRSTSNNIPKAMNE